MRGYEQLPGLDNATPRQTCRATIMHYCRPHDDASALARMIMTWWNPTCSATEFQSLTLSWAAQITPLFIDCQLSQCDKHILLSIQDRQPAITVVANVDPQHPERNIR